MYKDQHIVDALIARDEQVTHDFFFVWCRPLIYSLIRKVFASEVKYDEMVSELYVYLMENDAHRLRSFKGRSSIYQWLKCVATRFFLDRRDRRVVIEEKSSEPLYPVDEPSFEQVETEQVRSDIRKMLSMMRNERYRRVLKCLFIDGMDYDELAEDMNTSSANLYNIKKRAWAEFTAIVLKEYGKGWTNDQ